jgi:hypothetical protein
VWHLRRKLGLVKLPRRIQVALASRAAPLVLATLVSLESQLVLVALVPPVRVAQVSLESPLVLVALVPLVLVMLVSLESQLVLAGLAPLGLVMPASLESQLVLAGLAPLGLVAQVNPGVPQVRAALVSQVDQQDRLARAGLEGQAVQAGNPATRSHGAHNV